MALLDRQQLQLVDFEEMNRVHFEEVDIVNNIYDLILRLEQGEHCREELLEALTLFVEHTEKHFANEERLMAEAMFPAQHCHESEHQAALTTIRKVVEMYREQGNLNNLKQFFGQELVAWLNNHIATMDMVTATFLSQQKSGERHNEIF